jgi:amidase
MSFASKLESHRGSALRCRSASSRGGSVRSLIAGLLIAALPLAGSAADSRGKEAAPSSSFNILEATIPQLHAALMAGTVSSHQLVSIYLARIAAYDQKGPALNAISVINSKALDQADARDAALQAGGPHGLLFGIPIIVKDNYDTDDMQTAAGSLSLKGWIPPDNATLVQKLLDAGAIIIAKSNMHEYALDITTAGSLFGQTLNPYALNRNPGGSSGGTGAAIAANFAAAGMGSDSCGSIRIPSAHNSLVGIRATQGLASRTGIIPLSTTADMGGPMARTVTDVAVMLDAVVGYDASDPQTAASVGHIPASYTDDLKLTALRGARIGLLVDLTQSEPADAEVAEVIHRAADEMTKQGAEVVEVEIPDVKKAMQSSILNVDFKFDLNAYLAARPSAPVHSLAEVIASGKFSPVAVSSYLTDAEAVPSRDTKEYYEDIAKRIQLRQAILKVMADHQLQALLYPTMRRKAALIGQKQGGDNCALSANSGLPAITVPGGFTPDGLPVGAELLGRAWSEPQLIALAYAYEQATHHRHPPASMPALPPAAKSR